MAITPRSSVGDVLFPAIVRGEHATELATLFQLEQSQWWSPDALRAQQHRQLEALLRHARTTVPFYADRIEDAPLTPERWGRIPLLTRQEVRAHRDALESESLPPDHGMIFRRKTSGSTGEPLEVLGTEVTGFFWQCLALRDDLWHRRDLTGRLAVIRSGRYEPDPLLVQDFPGWGFLSPLDYESGPMTLFYHTMPIPQQAALLAARSPHYLLTYPSNARALCRYAREAPLPLPDLRAVHTYGEPLTPDVRAACRETWGVPVQDVYSCEELGYLALQCPHHEHHHVQSESALVEILDDAGRPVGPGEIGNVVLTSLHNFATPLIRYAIGDHAEVGGPCPCGRGLPVLSRVLGRRRNQVSLPGGRRGWPDVGALWAAIPEVSELQLVQRDQDRVEVRYVRARPVEGAEERVIAGAVHQALGHAFRLTFTREATIARQPNGKLETFVDPR